MKIYQTEAGVELTKEESELVNDFCKLMRRWEKKGRRISINGIAGTLTLLYSGCDAGNSRNTEKEMSDTGGFNQNNVINHPYFSVVSDGGDW